MGGESCKIFYDTTRFKLVEEGTFWYSDTTEISGSMTWGNTLPRKTTWGIFQIKNCDKNLVHKLFFGATDSTGFKASFIDLWLASGKTEDNAGTYNGFKGDKSGDRIDWILTTPQFHVANIQIIHDQFNNKYASDHFPVFAVVRL